MRKPNVKYFGKKVKTWRRTHLTEEDVEYSKDEVEWEFGREESEEPLAGVHVALDAQVVECLRYVGQLILQGWKNSEEVDQSWYRFIDWIISMNINQTYKS